jgi:hypothetical protein
MSYLLFGTHIDYFLLKIKKIMKMYMLSYLLNDLFNGMDSFKIPSDDDKNFNKKIEEFDNDTHVIKVETWTSIDGNTSFKRTTSTSKGVTNEVKIKDLEKELENAVRNEDFESAIILRDKIKNLKK